MAKVRLKSPEYEFATYDGKLVGIFDQVSGQVVPETCPKWFPAVMRQLETLKMVEVEDETFVGVGDDMFQGRDGKWVKIEPGSRLLCSAAGLITAVPALDFLRDYEPA